MYYNYGEPLLCVEMSGSILAEGCRCAYIRRSSGFHGRKVSRKWKMLKVFLENE